LDAGRNWHQKKDGFFLPGKSLAGLFKGKFLSGLKSLHDAGELCYEGTAAKYRNQYEYQELLNICYGKHWVTDIRESFAGAETVMHYLGRYTHRIAISNSRILRMDEETVTFRVKDYKNGGVMERIDLRGRGIRPAVFDACPSEKLRQDTSLRSAQQPQQGEADPSVQESDRLP